MRDYGFSESLEQLAPAFRRGFVPVRLPPIDITPRFQAPLSELDALIRERPRGGRRPRRKIGRFFKRAGKKFVSFTKENILALGTVACGALSATGAGAAALPACQAAVVALQQRIARGEAVPDMIEIALPATTPDLLFQPAGLFAGVDPQQVVILGAVLAASVGAVLLLT